jgi:hypothetical protein
MSKIKLSFFMLLSCLLFVATSHASTLQQLLRCSDTQFEQGAYGQYYGQTYHSTDQVCGGDSLGSGLVKIRNDGRVFVKLVNANNDPFVMYEIYWLPIGQDPVTHRVYLGNVLTDCNGNANTLLRPIDSPIDSRNAAPTNITTEVGVKDSGQFLFYSRGPWGDTDDGNCKPTNFNTSNNNYDGTLNNPELWGGTSNALFDGVQFISGYALSATKDSDGDGVVDIEDNCIRRSNPGQNDFDGDGLGNLCDTDDDNDGFSDKAEKAAGTDKFDATSHP